MGSLLVFFSLILYFWVYVDKCLKLRFLVDFLRLCIICISFCVVFILDISNNCFCVIIVNFDNIVNINLVLFLNWDRIKFWLKKDFFLCFNLFMVKNNLFVIIGLVRCLFILVVIDCFMLVGLLCVVNV